MSQPRILIVDDEPFNIDYLTQELEESGCAVLSAANGLEALEAVRSQAPDLVLLDIMMPVMDGFEVLARLKADPAARDIPVVVISASSDMRSVVKGISLGAEDYLPKPFEPALLHARVSSSLEKKRLLDIQKLYLKSLEREMEIAREIQQGFLPAELPSAAGWEVAVYFQSAREVAGDFYDAFLLPGGGLACVVGDVTDKGVGAALFMTLVRSLLRAAATSDVSCSGMDMRALAPAERLRHVVTFTNGYIAETHGDSGMFSTVFIGILAPQGGTLTYINCGNEPPLVFGKGGTVTTLPPTGPVVGVIPDAGFTVKEITLEVGDLLLAFTDGIPDSKDGDDHFFGSARLAQLPVTGGTRPAALLEDIQLQLKEFTGAADQFDDITLLAVKRTA